MKKLSLSLVTIIWLLVGITNYGATFAAVQHDFPMLAKEHYRQDMGFSIIMGLAGPFGLPAVFVGTGIYKHGLKFK